MLGNYNIQKIQHLDCVSKKGIMGLHLIIDYCQCNLKDFCLHNGDLWDITNLVKKKLDSAQIIVLETHSHFFSSNAVSLSFHLAESHLHFHTWPEKNYVSFDFFCCSQFENLEKRMIDVSEFCDSMFFKSKKKTQHVIPRGIL